MPEKLNIKSPCIQIISIYIRYKFVRKYVRIKMFLRQESTFACKYLKHEERDREITESGGGN
jgi:hypothetical protein